MEIEKTINYKGVDINIYQDNDATSPREYNDLSSMICFHSRYNLGDKHDYSDPEEFIWQLADIDYDSGEHENKTSEELNELAWKILNERKEFAILPLYLYDHSGITMNTSGFSCGWDSGQVGWIYTNKTMLDVMGISPEDRTNEKLEMYLKSDVEFYDQFITGQVYWYKIEDGEGSCGGFFGTDWRNNGLLEHAENDIDCYLERKDTKYKESLQRHYDLVKTYIKRKIPIIYREPNLITY